MLCLLKEMYSQQLILDQEIAVNHHITYEDSKEKRFLALLVELGELANATRCFKFWSYKPSESMERVLDEFADGLHFLLSLGIAYSYQVDSIEVDEEKSGDLSNSILSSYHFINEFYNNRTMSNYLLAFNSYLKILVLLGCSWKNAEDAYFKKLKENHHRQETNY